MLVFEMPIIQVNRRGRFANKIQHKRLAFRRQTIIDHCFIYIYACGIYAAVNFSYNMKYSEIGTMLH